MIAAEIFARGLVLAVLAFALVAGVALILGWLSRANGTIDRILADVYDWDREGDFEPPTWTRANHSPLAFIGPETVTVRCTCGYVHTEPITTTQASAYRSCTDEFWATHMQEVAA